MRKDVEKMSTDECEENGPRWHSLLKRSLSYAVSHAISSLFHHLPPLSYSTSPLHITPISHSLPRTVFSETHFLSYHLSPCLERLMFTVFIIPCLSSFDQEDSSQDLAAAAAALNQARPLNQQELINTVYFFLIRCVLCSKLGGAELGIC